MLELYNRYLALQLCTEYKLKYYLPLTVDDAELLPSTTMDALSPASMISKSVATVQDPGTEARLVALSVSTNTVSPVPSSMLLWAVHSDVCVAPNFVSQSVGPSIDNCIRLKWLKNGVRYGTHIVSCLLRVVYDSDESFSWGDINLNREV